jgi:hypothetical protein
VTLTVGKTLSPQVNMDQVFSQERIVDASVMAWIARFISPSPFMLDRIGHLTTFRDAVVAGADLSIGIERLAALPPEVNTWAITIGTIIGSVEIGDKTILQPA